ncbi:MAG: UTP--glucose-1-phosphate uridylyltransferase [Actinomycetia bacterium]|nr:UTP--glucose-1-phosphate uridylyltransferase [Actinomycetes bacterium]
MKALIPAAGLGTRFLPATKAVPKEMLPVLDKPAIQYVVEEALVAGSDEVLVITNRAKPAIERHFSPDPELVAQLLAAGKHDYAQAVEAVGKMPVGFVYQSAPLGLGHAVLSASGAVLGSPSDPSGSGSPTPEPFYVLLGDALIPDAQLLPRMKAISEAHRQANVIAVVEVPAEEVGRYGIIGGCPLQATEGVWQVEQLVEKPSPEAAPSRLAIFGRYLFSPRIMELLAETKPGAGGEIQLTDAMVALLAEEEMYALVIDAEEGYDVGTVEGWLETNARLAPRRG